MQSFANYLLTYLTNIENLPLPSKTIFSGCTIAENKQELIIHHSFLVKVLVKNLPTGFDHFPPREILAISWNTN